MAECVFYNFDPYRADRIRCKFCPQPDVVHDLTKSRYRRPCPRDLTPEELAERAGTLSSRKPCVPCAEERRQIRAKNETAPDLSTNNPQPLSPQALPQ